MQTKYSIDDTVFYINKDEIEQTKVIGTIAKEGEGFLSNPITNRPPILGIWYNLSNGASHIREEKLYPSKAELLVGLMTNSSNVIETSVTEEFSVPFGDVVIKDTIVHTREYI